jgi:5-methylcytosine-specific restriction endonuclease McrA
VDRGYKDPAKRKVYASRKWRGLRRTVLKENPWCSVPGCPNLATDIHHVHALEDGGEAYDRKNLEPLCKKHHSALTAKEVWGRKAYR